MTPHAPGHAPRVVGRAPGAVIPGTGYRLVRPLEPEVDPETGQVWIGTHGELDEELVLKLFPVGGPEVERLSAKMGAVSARAQTGLTHPGLVRVVDLGVTSAGEPFFVFEKLSGKTLRAELQASGLVPVPRALDITRQIVEGLALAHDMSALHGSICPEKVLCCAGGVVKLMGFGKILDLGASGEDALIPIPARRRNPASPYVAPELAAGGDPTPASDIFSIGVVLYEALTNKLPFASAPRSNPISPPSALAAQLVPADVDRVVLRALAIDPRERHATARELSADLGRVIARIATQGTSDTVDRPNDRETAPTRGGASGRGKPEGLGDHTAAFALGPPSSGSGAENVYTIVPGTLLAGKYRVVRIIGKGGMGLVVEARHLHLDIRVAMKFLLPEFMSYAEASGRFLREARAASRLTSHHVARVLDVGTLDGGEPYMVMEYLAGEDLAYHARASTPLTVGEAIDYVTQACDAISEAHKLGIVHRDVKPANLFLTRRVDGSPLVKVLDFGISKVLGDSSGDIALTQTTTILGSALYMSPEQMMSAKKVDHRTDIYALGVCVFELLGRQLPYFAESFPELCAKIFTSPPRSLVELRPDVPDALEKAIEKALARSPDERYQTVSEFIQALSPFARLDTRARMEALFRQHAPLLKPLPPAAMTATRAVTRRVAQGTERALGTASTAPPKMQSRARLLAAGLAVVAVAGLLGWRFGSHPAAPAAAIAEPAPESVAPAPSAAPNVAEGALPSAAPSASASADIVPVATAAATASGAPTAKAGADPPKPDDGAAGQRKSVIKNPGIGAGPVATVAPIPATSTPAAPINAELTQEKCFATMPDGTRKTVACP